LEQAGNHIFKNPDTSDIMYVQIRSFKGVTETLEDVAKEQLAERIATSDKTVTHTIAKDIADK
jgi:hypothetical protein